MQKSFFFRVFDHRFRDPVFDASRRIKILEFYEDGCRKAELFFGVDDLNKRRIADETEGPFINAAHGILLSSGSRRIPGSA